MYTIIEIAEYLNVTVNVVYKTIYQLQMVREKSENRKNYYSKEQLFRLKEFIVSPPEKTKYYPIKTIETYCLYESKMNEI